MREWLLGVVTLGWGLPLIIGGIGKPPHPASCKLPPCWFSGIDERRQAISRLPPRRSFGKSWESEEQKGQQSPRFYLRSWKATDGPEIIPGFSEIDSIVSSWCPIVVQDFVNNIESPHHQTYQYVDRRKGFLAARLIPGKGGRGHQAGREGSLLSTKWIIHLGTTNTFPPSNSQAETSAQVVGVSQEAVLNAGDCNGRGCMCKWEGGRVEPKLRMAPIWGKHCREWGQFRIGPILRQTRQRFHRRHFSPICHVINFSCTFMLPFGQTWFGSRSRWQGWYHVTSNFCWGASDYGKDWGSSENIKVPPEAPTAFPKYKTSILEI